ncbi:SRPBCC family protein [Streptomyces sp. NPDC002577]
MTKVHLQVTASATPAQVWDHISDFYALHTWQPLITATTPTRIAPTPASWRRATAAP